jgi:hypothetical protein
MQSFRNFKIWESSELTADEVIDRLKDLADNDVITQKNVRMLQFSGTKDQMTKLYKEIDKRGLSTYFSNPFKEPQSKLWIVDRDDDWWDIQENVNEKIEDALVRLFSSMVYDETFESPKDLSDLRDLIKSKKTEGTFNIRFTEEIKDGRSSRFDEKSPLALKRHVISHDTVEIMVKDVDFVDSSDQPSESDNRYVDYIYRVKVTITYR